MGMCSTYICAAHAHIRYMYIYVPHMPVYGICIYICATYARIWYMLVYICAVHARI